ncbi:uncharacterized protein zbbx isoform X2 [Mugil cephalus]|uniref:uncharacterized protein zbbx isoform X2 n=1 Tax=Mugil cephalus TaxID=48193 RepID=UPI001FB75401|nr:uncharacterized protein zbbx isoform X2 [Mugil cephalus]
MNLNDFVVLRNNKARSVKLNARNLQEMHMETVTLANESKEMEEKLQQLKDSMSKEKEERGNSGNFRWTSGRCASSNSNSLTNSSKKNKEIQLQKLSAGKLKIRVLKDEPLIVPPHPPPPPPTVGLQMARKNRLKGTICGQCEAKTAGLMCAECAENYCVGCFARFHQKGALKLHRMIPIQTNLQTHVTIGDVVSCIQKQSNSSSFAGTFMNPSSCLNKGSNHAITSNATTRWRDESPEKGTEVKKNHMKFHPHCSQELRVNHEEETKVGNPEDVKRGFSRFLHEGEYDEEESARSFQEALQDWRGRRSDGGLGFMNPEAMWIPVRPVSVSAMATQADLPPERDAEGQRRAAEGERTPIKVEFTGNSLSYIDRLLLKKHRRTPIDTNHPSLTCGKDLKSIPTSNTEEETESTFTAEEEDFRRYCASLFDVTVSRDSTEPQSTTTTPVSCIVIEVLDETNRDTKGVCAADQKTDDNTEMTSVQQFSKKEKILFTQTASAFSSKHKPPACLATDTALRASIKTPTSKLPRSISSPTIQEPKAKCGSPQLPSSLPHSQSEVPKSSLLPDVLANNSPAPEERLTSSPSVSFSLRSTFTVLSSSATESILLPKVYHSVPLQKDPGSSLSTEQLQSCQLFAEQISSLKLSGSSRSNLMPPQQFQHYPESLVSDNQLQLPLSPLSDSPHPPPKTLVPNLPQISPVLQAVPSKTPSRLSQFNECSTEAYFKYRSTPKYEDSPVISSTASLSGDHKSTLSHQDMQDIQSSYPLNVNQDLSSAVETEEEEEVSIDSGDEMSSDSLGLAPHEGDSSDEEAQTYGRLTRGRSREEKDNPAISHLRDCFVRAEAEEEKDLQTDTPEQLSEPSMVRNQSAGPGSERVCDLDGFSPLGFDMNAGHSDTPEPTHCGPLHTCQFSLHDADPTESFGSRSSLRSDTEECLVFGVMKDTYMQSSGIQIHSTNRREIQPNELGTSGPRSNLSTPALSHTLRTKPRSHSTLVSPRLSHSPPSWGSEFGSAFRPLSRAAQEIMEICGVDQLGCEDPDLDSDTAANTLHSLEQELRVTATGTQALVFGTGNGGSQDQHNNHRFTLGRVSDQQKEEEEAANRDRQSVLSLP